MSDFYKRLDDAEQSARLSRLFSNRPANLHDYQGCANDPNMVAAHRTHKAPAEAQEDHIAHSHEMVTQPTHSAAERERAAEHIICERDAEIVQLTLALDAANTQIAEARLLLNRAEPPNAMLDAKLLWIRERNQWMQKGTPNAR